jgi:hypothetical protein
MRNNCSRTLCVVLWFISVYLPAQSFTKVLRTDVARIAFAADHLSPLGVPNGGWYASMRGLGDQQVAIARFSNAGGVLWSKLLKGRRDVDALMALGDGGVLVFGNNQEVDNYFDPTVLHLSATGEIISDDTRYKRRFRWRHSDRRWRLLPCRQW